MNLDVPAFSMSASNALQNLGRASWQGGVLIAIIAILCRIAPRLPAGARCALWWIACLKLMLSLARATPLQIALLPPTPAAIVQPAEQVRLASSLSERRSIDSLGGGQAKATRNKPIAITRSTDWSLAALVPMLTLLWLTGVAARGGISLIPLLRLRRLLRQAAVIDAPELLPAADEIAAKLRLRQTPRLLLTAEPVQPLVLGRWKPMVLLSQADVERLSASQLRAVLAHEFAHIRQGDLWLGLVPLAAQVCFWFHPFAWLAGREYALSREAACDILARQVTRMPIEEYGRLLITFGTAHNAHSSALALGAASNYRMLQRRIVMMHQTPRVSGRLLRVGLTSLFASIILLGLIPWRLVSAQSPAAAFTLSRQTQSRMLFSLHQGAGSGGPVFITAHIRQPLANAIDTLFRASGVALHYRLDPALMQSDYEEALAEKITVNADNSTLDLALQDLLDQSSRPISYRIEQGVYVIGPAGPNTKPAIRVDLRVQQMPLDQAVDRLFRTIHAAYRLDLGDDVRKLPISLSVTKATIPGTLDMLVNARGDRNLEWRRQQDIYVISQRRIDPFRGDPSVAASANNSVPDGNNGPISINAKNADFGVLLRNVLNRTGWNYVYALPADLHEQITMQLHNVSARQALDKILAVSPKTRQLAYRAADGILILAPGNTFQFYPRTKPSEMKFTLRLKNVDPYTGLKAIFRTVPAQFTLDPSMRNDTLNIIADGAAFDVILKRIAAACSTPMSVHEESEVYSFVPK